MAEDKNKLKEAELNEEQLDEVAGGKKLEQTEEQKCPLA
ncbi:hypothetical protein SAMN05216463_10514 [Xylanibacter ruminicola]|uniref:Uncharacterized protein n=1 Tax=Xylanibacter ruminicola TaxID=839 RepID=A0A1M6T5U0_XYLRU|nr:hypothetical protein SAMN05216463_10514 [Xylanibacter ruminicola]